MIPPPSRFDTAFERFWEWAIAQGETLLTLPEIDFKDIHGPQHEVAIGNLQRYFVKLLGCRLADEGLPIPARLAEILADTSFVPFSVSIATRLEWYGR